MWPPEIGKGAATNDAPGSPLTEKTACRTVYRCDSKSATHGRLRLVDADANLGKKLLKHACADVRVEPSRLPLWAFRLYQHQRLGRLGYQAIWDGLYEAGRESGSDKWVRGCLLHAIGQANASMKAPPSARALLRGLV